MFNDRPSDILIWNCFLQNFPSLTFSLSRPISSPFSSQILTVLSDHFEGDILFLSDFLCMRHFDVFFFRRLGLDIQIGLL
ncbi:unnamed protein product [Rhizophagus irregularis]|nr:unnamed protein product [Rhizophagus irregularis]